MLFTGKNPERRAKHDAFLSKVELGSLGFVLGGSGKIIANLIRSMLEIEPGNRPSAEELFQLWQGAFFNLAEQQNAIEGRVFER